jgi:outer membrane protein assembly factor BamE
MHQTFDRARPRALLRAAFLTSLLAALLASGGCVYRINVQQGNFLDAKAVDQLAPGMPRSQVRLLLGTPMSSSAFDSDRWDYVYYFKQGRHRKIERRKVTVFFEGDKVSRIERPQGDDKNKDRVADSKPSG